jgi:CRISPR-associated protein Cas5h
MLNSGDIMDCLIFDIEGKFAHFRKIYTNSSSLSYIVPPRTTIVGMIAGILGRERDSYYEEFSSDKLHISVKVESKIYSIMQTLNYIKATSPKGIFKPKDHTQIPFEALTSQGNIRYRIYVASDDKTILEELEERLVNERYVYPPYLGVAFFTGSINYIDKAEIKKEEDDKFIPISTVVNVEYVSQLDISSIEDIVMLKELMPRDFKEGRNICKSSSYLVTQEPRNIIARLSVPYFIADYNGNIENIVFM